MKKLNLRLWRLIRRSKGQYIAILIVVITGLFIYTALNNASTNLETSLYEYYKTTNFADVYVDLMKIPSSKISDIASINNIKEIDGRIVFDAPLLTKNKDEKVNVRIVSVDGSENLINKLYLEAGERKISSKKILILKQFANARGLLLGDYIDIQINGRKYNFQISGFVSSPEYTYLMENEQSLMPRPDKFGIVFIEEEYLGAISGMNGNFNDIVITLKDYSKYNATEKDLEKALDKYGVKRLIEKDDQLSNSIVHEEINGLKQISGFIPIVFLFTAAAILAAMISRTVKNDRIVIGILKALGYSNKKILLHYTMYAVSIGVIGGLIGILLGTLMSGLMTKLYIQFFYIPLLKVKIYPMNIVNAIILSSIFCTFAGLFGARKVLKISPAESMRSEPPKQSTRILMERVKFIWNKLSFTWKIVYRNIFREKKKFILISMGAAFTMAMSLMTFWLSGMMGSMFNEHYGEFMSMDYNISFSRPIEENSMKDIDKLIDSDYIEAKMEIPFEISYGRNSKVVSIVGLEKDTNMFRFRDFYGNRVELPEEGILISSNLADALEVGIGDKVLIKNFIPDMDDVYIEIKDINTQILGINGYMNLDYMGKMLTGYNTINGALIKTDNNISENLTDLKNIGGVQSIKEMQDTFLEYLDLTIVSVVFMVLFSGILGFVIIYSMTILSINERKMEFSSLRVLGFTKREIFGIILKENFVMAAIGVLYGIPFGKVLIDGMRTIYVSDLYTFNAPITIISILYAMIYTAACLTMAQLITYRKINHLNFIEALKSRTS